MNVLKIGLGLETQTLQGPSLVIKSTRQDCIMHRSRIRLKLGCHKLLRKKKTILWKGLFRMNQGVFYKSMLTMSNLIWNSQADHTILSVLIVIGNIVIGIDKIHYPSIKHLCYTMHVMIHTLVWQQFAKQCCRRTFLSTALHSFCFYRYR